MQEESVPNANRDKGLRAERDVVTYLRGRGLDARRVIATGTALTPDAGDVAAPPFAIQVKSLARRLDGKLLFDTWRETVKQAAEAARQSGRETWPLIIEKRAGTADVGRWWLHTDSGVYVRMLTGRWQWVGGNFHLVRVEVGDVINDLAMWSREAVSQAG